MGIGHLSLRKLIKRETEWVDKSSNKHKHNFIIHSILEEKSPNGQINYYNVIKCDQCNSFKSISEKGNVSGMILDKLTEEQRKLPLIKCTKKHNYLIGFYDIDKIICIEKYIVK